MEKVIYHDTKKLGFPFYLTGIIVFATLFICHLVTACLAGDALVQNQSILNAVTAFVGTALMSFGFYNILAKGRLPHAFFLTGMVLSLLSLSMLFETLLPVFMDKSTGGLTSWGIAAVAIFTLLILDGIIGSALPKRYLYTRKFMIILGMTVLIAIEGTTFVSKVIDFAHRGWSVSATTLLALLNAYTYLAPLAILGIGIAFLLEVSQEKAPEEKDLQKAR